MQARVSELGWSVIGLYPDTEIEPIVSVAMVRTVPLEEPTLLEALAQRILNPTVNCGEKSPVVNPDSTVQSAILDAGVGQSGNISVSRAEVLEMACFSCG